MNFPEEPQHRHVSLCGLAMDVAKLQQQRNGVSKDPDCHSWPALGCLTSGKRLMILGCVSQRVEMESRYVSRPSESHMFGEGACDLAVISV